MSSGHAIALDFSNPRPGRVPVPNRRKRARTAVLPLAEVLIASALELRPAIKGKPPVYMALLALAAIAIHGAVVWYVTHLYADKAVVPVKREVAVELVRPPPPVEPKIEPPKPVKQQPKRPAKVLPPIQTAMPEPATVAETVASEPPVAVEPIATAPPAPVVEEVTEPVGRAGYLNNPPPEYPSAAARQNWEGTVVLRVRVLSTGRVETVEIRESSGRRILDDQAVRTVKQWLFTPSKRGATPIDGWATVPIEFKLDG
jgi:protein TonB